MRRVFGTIPKEPPRIVSLESLAPYVRLRVEYILQRMKELGHRAMVFEAQRTDERQEWLFEFGRSYDDGRGIVTGAATGDAGWHKFGFAVDIVEADATPWVASQQFWNSLGRLYEEQGMTWGGRWKAIDLPHGQWGRLPRRPTLEDIRIFATEGKEALWRKYA